MKLTRYGCREWLGALILALIIVLVVCTAAAFLQTGWSVPAAISIFILLIWLCIAAFFRDPERKIPVDQNTVLSPADGVVHDIELIKNETVESEKLRSLFHGRDILRVGIFLSVFNVHLNRAPVPMKVVFREYRKGAFHDARDGRAAKENESMLLGAIGFCGENEQYPLAVKQISGAIARRIVCPVNEGDQFEQGQQYGMIKFGSRTELYLAAGMGFELLVKVGQPVTAGITPLVQISSEAKEKIKVLQEQEGSLEEGANQ